MYVGEERKLEETGDLTHFTLTLAISFDKLLIWMVHKKGTDVNICGEFFLCTHKHALGNHF